MAPAKMHFQPRLRCCCCCCFLLFFFSSLLDRNHPPRTAAKPEPNSDYRTQIQLASYICDDPALCRCVWLAAFGSRVICVPRCCCCFCCIRLRWIVSFGTQQTNNIYKRRSIQIQLRRVYIYIKKWEGEKRLKIRVINQVPKAGNEGGERKKRKSYRKAEQ